MKPVIASTEILIRRSVRSAPASPLPMASPKLEPVGHNTRTRVLRGHAPIVVAAEASVVSASTQDSRGLRNAALALAADDDQAWQATG